MCSLKSWVQRLVIATFCMLFVAGFSITKGLSIVYADALQTAVLPMSDSAEAAARRGDNSDLGGLIFTNPSLFADTDADGFPDHLDPDDDNDGVPDVDDAFPFDAGESSDFDADGIGDNADTDDDNDGTLDINDDFPLNAARTKPIQPAFPVDNGIVDFPDHALGNQLEWVLQQITASSTPLAEIEARFVSGYDPADMQNFFDVLRTSFPNAEVVEILNVTARQAVIVIGDPVIPGSTGGYIDLRIRFSDGKINYFFVQNFPQNPSSTTIADQGLSITEAATKITTLADGTSVLVAQIEQNNQCVPTFSQNEMTPRATGSIFKVWVLGALAKAVDDGVITPDQMVALTANEIVPVGEALSTEPLGTLFSVRDMSNMMMGTSDNTATDHMHELVGRARAEAILTQFAHSNAALMTPFLSINETFHLYWTVPEVDALAYAFGTESEQRDYLDNVLVPLGPVTAFPNANASILVDGTWQASPMDLCNAIAALRQFNDTTESFALIDQAYSSNEGVWALRRNWERVWFKGGSLADGSGLLVLTLGWLLETDDRGAFVVIGMANTQSTSPTRIDQNAFFSVMSRITEIVNESN